MGQISEEEVKPTLTETGVGCFLGKKSNGVEIRKLILIVQSWKFTQKNGQKEFGFNPTCKEEALWNFKKEKKR